MKSLFLFGALCGVGVSADLRAASQPRANFAVRQRNPVQFVSQSVIYMEPSDFNYAGLKAQRNGGNQQRLTPHHTALTPLHSTLLCDISISIDLVWCWC